MVTRIQILAPKKFTLLFQSRLHCQDFITIALAHSTLLAATAANLASGSNHAADHSENDPNLPRPLSVQTESGCLLPSVQSEPVCAS